MSERERRFREAVVAYGEQDPEALLAYMTEDVVWVEDPAWPDGQTWHGHQGVRDALRERLDTTSIAVEIDNVVERGDVMLVEFVWRAVGSGSGAEAVMRPAVVQRYRGDLVCHVRFFLDRHRAREAFDAA
jgi:ketosteroid isomerase-like protein